jgi:hypothetical protein
MQIRQLDWMLLDALLFTELISFQESVLSGTAFGEINWRYVIAGQDPKKLLWTSLLAELASGQEKLGVTFMI